jgi:hypothetical protein
MKVLQTWLADRGFGQYPAGQYRRIAGAGPVIQVGPFTRVAIVISLSMMGLLCLLIAGAVLALLIFGLFAVL